MNEEAEVTFSTVNCDVNVPVGYEHVTRVHSSPTSVIALADPANATARKQRRRIESYGQSMKLEGMAILSTVKSPGVTEKDWKSAPYPEPPSIHCISSGCERGRPGSTLYATFNPRQWLRRRYRKPLRGTRRLVPRFFSARFPLHSGNVQYYT